MKLVEPGLLAVLLASGAMAQTVSKPAVSKPAVSKPATVAPSASIPQGGDTDIGKLLVDAQKDALKERRQDRDTANNANAAALAAKGAKLEQDNAQIAGQMGEAKEKADNAMASANIQLTTGVISSAVQTGAGPQGQAAQPKVEKGNQPAVKPCKDCIAPVKPE